MCLLAVLGVVFLVSMLWTASRGAPWAPTPMSAVHKMLAMAEVSPEDVVYDLGCGDGRLIIAAARLYGARAMGIELDPLRYTWCQLVITLLGLGSRVRVVQGDSFSEDLTDADVVTCYLLQSTNEKLEAKLEKQLRPTARVVSNEFIFPGQHLIRQDAQAGIRLPDLDVPSPTADPRGQRHRWLLEAA